MPRTVKVGAFILVLTGIGWIQARKRTLDEAEDLFESRIA